MEARFIVEQTTAILNKAQNLLTPEEVMAHLRVTQDQLRKWRTSTSGKKPRLPAVRLGHRTVRYRLADVIHLERAGYGG